MYLKSRAIFQIIMVWYYVQLKRVEYSGNNSSNYILLETINSLPIIMAVTYNFEVISELL